MSEPTDADARRVLARFDLSAAPAEALGNHGGFSGARIWRVHTDRGDYCLKAWPPGTMSPEGHAAIVRLVNHASQSGLSYVPRVLYVVSPAGGVAHFECAGGLWDLSEWMPGSADFHANPSPARLRAACLALARLHRAWERFASPPGQCPAVIRRLIAAGEWLDATVATFSRLFETPWRSGFTDAGGDSLDEWARRARKVIEKHLPRIPPLLMPWRSDLLPIQPCLCDVWHDHVLFTGDDVTGLIDYGAMKPDNIAVDLARMLGSLVGDNLELYEMGLDGYAAVRPLSDVERRLVPVLDRTGVVLGLANWLRRQFQRGCGVQNRDAVARRMSELVLRAENWASIEP